MLLNVIPGSLKLCLTCWLACILFTLLEPTPCILSHYLSNLYTRTKICTKWSHNWIVNWKCFVCGCWVGRVSVLSAWNPCPWALGVLDLGAWAIGGSTLVIWTLGSIELHSPYEPQLSSTISCLKCNVIIQILGLLYKHLYKG